MSSSSSSDTLPNEFIQAYPEVSLKLVQWNKQHPEYSPTYWQRIVLYIEHHPCSFDATKMKHGPSSMLLPPLDLSGSAVLPNKQKLTVVPPLPPFCQVVDLSMNRIIDLNACNTHVTMMDLRYNEMDMLPDLVFPNLVKLDISYNALQIVPMGFTQSKVLDQIDFSYNDIRTFPSLVNTCFVTYHHTPIYKEHSQRLKRNQLPSLCSYHTIVTHLLESKSAMTLKECVTKESFSFFKEDIQQAMIDHTQYALQLNAALQHQQQEHDKEIQYIKTALKSHIQSSKSIQKALNEQITYQQKYIELLHEKEQRREQEPEPEPEEEEEPEQEEEEGSIHHHHKRTYQQMMIYSSPTNNPHSPLSSHTSLSSMDELLL